ncbi:WbuC family cupin fold metalloprotein [Cytophagaceae bacterium DM2B3-1]|uniref:WbuC family cupin fold metalloprotein n=1 Tax=Xanthocytophaga flava TaxID=3048013 RepID=A0ABT7CRJ7_9BACT|nr:WbuC family cupin fold metalloprotein [Xanthocytophaga flavus]MDJ1468598.1 WbuC family cupin fold metalloprotein [Xanthocytophaga flavus]MDJ1496378.1 WbuC family cupin fold metalloprotein [Xanthocytophaga flavus]
MFIPINQALLDQVSEKAQKSLRLRMNHNFHHTPDDLLNRMLNAMEPGTYVHPHKHENPDKREAFLILRGRLLVIAFDDMGNIIDHMELNPLKGNFGLEIPPRTYHTLITLEAGTVVYELKDGPYNVLNDKQFAPWAPAEGSAESANYMKQLLTQLALT